MNDLKVGDFVKHRENDRIIFQVVDILEPIGKNNPRMIVCNRVRDLYSYLETDCQRYDLTVQDRESITERRGIFSRGTDPITVPNLCHQLAANIRNIARPTAIRNKQTQKARRAVNLCVHSISSFFASSILSLSVFHFLSSIHIIGCAKFVPQTF